MKKPFKRIIIITIAILVFVSALPNSVVFASALEDRFTDKFIDTVDEAKLKSKISLTIDKADNIEIKKAVTPEIEETDIRFFVFGGADKSIITDFLINLQDLPPRDVVIPKSYVNGSGNTLEITGIGNHAFAEMSSFIDSIKLNDNLKMIGDRAFQNTNRFSSIIIPNSVEHIGSAAFINCTSLKSVTIGDGVTRIQPEIFSGCSGLTSIIIPDGVTSIGSGAFDGCTGLTSATIPDSVTSIGSGAFDGCTGLTSATIPDSVTSIGKQAFYRCISLTSVKIPDNVTNIGISAFQQCVGLTSVTIGSGLTNIGDSIFANCSGLTSVTIPDSVASIEINAFSSCSGLTSVKIPDSVASIGKGAFKNCTGLTSVTIGSGLTSIGSEAFYYCTKLTSITFPAKLKEIGFSTFTGTKIKIFKLPKSIKKLGDGGNNTFDATTKMILIDMSRAEAPLSLTNNEPWGATNAKIFFTEDSVAFSYDIEKKGYERLINYRFVATDKSGLIQEVTLPDGNTISVGSQDTYEGTYMTTNNGTYDFSVSTASATGFPYQVTIDDIGNIDLLGNNFAIKKSNLDNTATIADLFTRGAIKATDIDKNIEIAVVSNKTLEQIKKTLINNNDCLDITLTSTNDFTSISKVITITIDNSLNNSIKFMKGIDLLKEEMVQDGGVAKRWSPDSEVGMVFDDWYSDEQLSNKFDFNTKITKDEVLYAKWKKTEPVQPDVPVTPEKPTNPDVPVAPKKHTNPDKGDNGSTGVGSDIKNTSETSKDDGSIEKGGAIVRHGDDSKKTTSKDKEKEEVKSGFKIQDAILPIWIILYAGGYMIIRSKKED